jgi:hypothetical protein
LRFGARPQGANAVGPLRSTAKRVCAQREGTLGGLILRAVCDLILEERPHPEQGFRSCLVILRLARLFGVARLTGVRSRSALTYGSSVPSSTTSSIDTPRAPASG